MNEPVISFWSHAASHRDDIAVVEPDGAEVSFGTLLDDANRVVHGLRALGLGAGDCVAMHLPNGAPVVELFMAVAQAGMYLTPINSHLAAPEVRYILEDSGAKAVVMSPRFPAGLKAAREMGFDERARFVVGEAEGFRPFAELKQGQPTTTPDERVAGQPMTYTSGTTGRPKGVRRAIYPVPPEMVSTRQAMFLGLFGILPGSPGVHLVVAPMYHTAVLNFATNHLHLGHTLVLMDRWTPEGMLERIQKYGVTSSHMVPTMFIRALKLPDDVRLSYDVSSVRHMIHSAAPCPIDVKRRMLEWWGPNIYEYYAASEGGGTLATPDDWQKKPGTVGKAWPISTLRILDDDDQPVPAGEPGTVWMSMGEHTFRYHGDDEKTERSWKDGFFTVGDAGYLDEDGYLFLCDRKADMIISGGVNIYPAEIESALVAHPGVYDVAVFGVPHDEFGETVKAVIQPADGRDDHDALRAELKAWASEHLAKYKCPRSYDFMDELPRDPNGKLYKRKLRDPYWEGKSRGGAD